MSGEVEDTRRRRTHQEPNIQSDVAKGGDERYLALAELELVWCTPEISGSAHKKNAQWRLSILILT
jgi:hypothetical protein